MNRARGWSVVLGAGDAGDGIASDHADWAEAKVVLADGRELWLGDLPEATGGRALPFSFVYGGTPWMVEHNLPRPGGRLVTTHYGSCWSITLNPSAEEELVIVDGFQREGIRLDYYFIDAGWYPNRGSWVNVGTWEDAPEGESGRTRGVEIGSQVNRRREPGRVSRRGFWRAEGPPERPFLSGRRDDRFLGLPDDAGFRGPPTCGLARQKGNPAEPAGLR